MTKKEEFIKVLKNHEKLSELKNNLYYRQRVAAEEKEELETLLLELKEKRPKMLADEKDITKLNQEIKDAQEKIEIKNDEILGVSNKLNQVSKDYEFSIFDTNSAYIDYANSKKIELQNAYNQKAKEFVEILMDYLVVEDLSDCSYRSSYIRSIADEITKIPQAGDFENPLFKNFELFSK